MSDEIKPALSAEEWRGEDSIILSTESAKLGHFVTADWESGVLELHVVGPTTFVLTDDDRHTLAALALHRQPYGFTREAVADVREAIDAVLLAHDGYCTNKDTCGCMERVDRLRAHAARIAALLPPEDA